jgi:hypothetical protein
MLFLETLSNLSFFQGNLFASVQCQRPTFPQVVTTVTRNFRSGFFITLLHCLSTANKCRLQVGEFYITEYTKFKRTRFESFAMLSHGDCEIVTKNNSGLLRSEMKEFCSSSISVTLWESTWRNVLLDLILHEDGCEKPSLAGCLYENVMLYLLLSEHPLVWTSLACDHRRRPVREGSLWNGYYITGCIHLESSERLRRYEGRVFVSRTDSI